MPKIILEKWNQAVFTVMTLHRYLDRYRLAKARNFASETYSIKLSYVIATYNRSKILAERTIPALLSQTMEDIEIIVVGDHVIDDTEHRLTQINDPRLAFHDLPTRGRYPTNPENRWFVQGTVPRNHGMKIARGKWLCFPSDDDVLDKDHAKRMLEFAESQGVEFAGALCTEHRNGKDQIVGKNDLSYLGATPTWIYRSYLRCFSWSTESWRKKYNRPTDIDLAHRMLRAGVTHATLPEVLAYKPAVEGTNTVGYDAHKILAQRGALL